MVTHIRNNFDGNSPLYYVCALTLYNTRTRVLKLILHNIIRVPLGLLMHLIFVTMT